LPDYVMDMFTLSWHTKSQMSESLPDGERELARESRLMLRPATSSVLDETKTSVIAQCSSGKPTCLSDTTRPVGAAEITTLPLRGAGCPAPTLLGVLLTCADATQNTHHEETYTRSKRWRAQMFGGCQECTISTEDAECATTAAVTLPSRCPTSPLRRWEPSTIRLASRCSATSTMPFHVGAAWITTLSG
jgi:hypothetical protein